MMGNGFGAGRKFLGITLVLIFLISVSAGAYAVDTITINSATLNGASSVIVAPNASITASVNATLNGGPGFKWMATQYQIGSATPICRDITDQHNTTHTDTFSVIAPAIDGISDFKITLFKDNGCAVDKSIATITLSSGITVDATPPVISGATDIVTEATGPTGATVTYSVSANDAVDGSVAVDCSPASGSSFGFGLTAVNCSATDAHANTANASFNVTVRDTTAPSAAITSITDGTHINGTVTIDATASDSASGVARVEFYHSSMAPVYIGEDTTEPYSIDWDTTSVSDGSHTIYVKGIDNNLNESGYSEVSVVVDNTAPVLSVPSDMLEEATSAAGAAVSYVATATDAIEGAVAIDCSPASGSTFALGTITVTCGASDSLGNTASTSFDVTVEDTTPPTIDSMSDIIDVEATSPAGAEVSYTSPATTDLVDGSGTATCLPASGSTFVLGDTTVTCNATDAAGNGATSVEFTVSVVDTTSPVITLNGDNPMTVQVHNAYSEADASVTDNYDTGLTAAITGSVDVDTVGTYTRYYNAVDSHGNSAIEVTRTVNVVDEEAPSTSDDVPALWQTSDVTVTLNCTDNVACTKVYYTTDGTDPTTSSDSVDAGSGWQFTVSTDGQYTVKYFGVDDSSNAEAVKTATNLLRLDETVPNITAPTDVIEEATGPTTSVSLGEPITSDDTSGVYEVHNDSPGVFPVGSTTVTWTVTDNAGNSNTATQSVTINDTTPPVIDSVENIIAEAASSAGAVVTITAPTATDLVDGSITATCDESTGLFPIGITTVTCNATDSHANSATPVSFDVNVVDTTAPSITAPADVTKELTGFLTDASAELGSPIVSDLVDSNVIVDSNAPSAGFPVGITTVLWTATDHTGNSATAFQKVTITSTPVDVNEADMNSLISSGAFVSQDGGASTDTNAVVALKEITITSNNSSVLIPAGVVITRSDGSNIDATALIADGNVEDLLSNLGSGAVLDGALKWGLPNLELSFSPAIQLSIFVGYDLNGTTLSIERSTSGSNGWTSAGLTPSTCVVANGLCDFNATLASYYATTHTVSTNTSSGGGSGRGGGMPLAVVQPTTPEPTPTPTPAPLPVTTPTEPVLTPSEIPAVEEPTPAVTPNPATGLFGLGTVGDAIPIGVIAIVIIASIVVLATRKKKK
ncbi:HYR domain protein [uncultured archaeon]|nr:HYR domain protein [uncultured archaeon]